MSTRCIGNNAARLLLSASLCLLVTATAAPPAADSGDAPATASDTDPVAAALHASLMTGIRHAHDWLAAGDFKSLAQSADDLRMLAELTRSRGDDAKWQEAIGQVIAEARTLRQAAESSDPGRCRMVLDSVERASTFAKSAYRHGGSLSLPQVAGGLRPLMLLMDGIRGDAKVALLTGRAADAKQAGYVLSELGRVVSASRRGGAWNEKEWSELSSAFTAAALRFARSPGDDLPTAKQLLRDVSQRCDACHEGR